MSSPRTRIVTLNLGSQSIELAEFRAEAQGLILCGYCSRELFVEPGGQGMRQEQMGAALREMLSELRIKSGEVNYTVAEELVFSRFVKLPALGEEKLERIISFEAQQNVPFPIDEVVWDYQLVGGGLGEQIQVVLVAIKADLLDAINRAVEETGLRTAIVDLAPMALYNAFCYNYAGLSGCSLLIDIGARTTNLLFVEPGRIFTRSVAIGGISITAAIAKEFNEPFAAAEFRKKRDGVAGLGAGSLEGDAARVSKIVRNTMTRLHAELMRSISHYAAQQMGNPPARIFLAGGGACTPSLREFFHEKMGLPTEFFDGLRNVAVLDSAPVDKIARAPHLLGEPVGLALRVVSVCPMRLNLRPAGVVRRQELEKRRPLLVAAAACFIAGLLTWGAYYWRAGQIKERTTAQLEEKVAAMRRIETQMNQVRKEIGALDNLSGPLVGAISDRAFWPSVLEDLNARLPRQDIWITELVPTSAGKPLSVPEARTVAIAMNSVSSPRPGATPAQPVIDGLLVRGLYLFNPRQQEVVVEYFKDLVESPWFAVDPKNQAKVIKPTTPNNTEWAFPYELRLDLKKPVPLP
jgi:type IV pilus assembly protein PilM